MYKLFLLITISVFSIATFAQSSVPVVERPSLFAQLFIAASPVLVIMAVMWWHARYMHKLSQPNNAKIVENLERIAKSLEKIANKE